ncbi:tyrosine-protein kinase Mer-like [Patiria miniata]|uniref:receptor protein-tyrosine kinase n=1 Tax=Patiria miniata TaxID=46514 RepID=A0A914ANV3_PATMI|nr:tyrosine-protein kinase Mer-like [Patiria miniata]
MTIKSVTFDDEAMYWCEIYTRSPFQNHIATKDMRVRGPPATPVIIGGAAMIEDAPTILTCTADMGYPDDWTLVWSNGGSPITGTNTSSSAAGSRFNFTSILNLTPRKEDSGNNITCAAQRASWTVSPQGTLGPIDVRYVPVFLAVSSPANPVFEGRYVSMSCLVDANPRPDDIIWEKQGPGIAPSYDMSVYNDISMASVLTLGRITREQSGYYSCRTNNGVPTDDPSSDVVSTKVPVIVQYEVNITNKAMIEVGVNDGDDAVLTCVAVGNPRPVMEWYGLNNTDITTDSQDGKFLVTNEISGGDGMFALEVTSTLTINAVDSGVDYGVYTCNSSNGIGRINSLTITLTGIKRPDKPTSVEITERTAEFLTVTWTAGYDGGETPSFRVSCIKTSDSTEVFTEETGGKTTSTATGLDDYTEYEIRVYAKNSIGESIGYGNTMGYTLPSPPSPETGIVIEFNTDSGSMKVEWLKEENGCIQLEVQYQGNDTWQECGDCIESDQTVTLSEWCASSQRRRRRAVGDIEAVRARLCIGGLCSQPTDVRKVKDPPAPDMPGDNPGISVGVIVGVIIGLFVLIAIVVLGVFAKRNFGNHGKEDRETVDLSMTDVQRHSTIPQSDAQSPYQEITELAIISRPTNQEPERVDYANVPTAHKSVPRDQLKIIKELGHGNFGLVLLAEASGMTLGSKVTLVAVKTLKEGAGQSDKADMMRELDLMKKLPDHCNVVRLLGFCVEEDPPYIIVEYLSRGNLKDLLKDSRSKGGRVYGNLHGISKSLTSKDLMKFAKDVADGMAFISSQQCIHRDLAARNVLVAEDMTCKVSDFGLARDVMNIRVYERRSEGPLPMRWMALESILDDVYTAESDVWSYGVLLWEIVTLGARPYPAMTANVMIGKLQSGYRMPKPQHCQQELYAMMLRCWDDDPDNRPTFTMISAELEKYINKGKEFISIKDFQRTVYEVVLEQGAGEKV